MLLGVGQYFHKREREGRKRREGRTGGEGREWCVCGRVWEQGASSI